jgi:two-component system KDP operon response regulator KdpE
MRILVVEDDRSMRELLATALELAGAVVETVASGEEALAGDGHYDLALVDLGLGDLRGDAVLAELRQRGRVSVAALVSGSSVPPILTPEGEPDAWLRKPFELDDLLATIQQLLAREVTTGAVS